MDRLNDALQSRNEFSVLNVRSRWLRLLRPPNQHVTISLPIVKPEELQDLVFSALASRIRRAMLDVVRGSPGCSLRELCEHFEISRIGVMKHLQVLVDAHLVLSRKQGRTRELYFNAAPIQQIHDRWSDEYSAFWTTQAVDLKYRVEAKAKTRSKRKTKKVA